MNKEIDQLKVKIEQKDSRIGDLEKANEQNLKYIDCIQKDCEQVVSAKEEWLQVMRSFKESEEKVYNKYKNLRKQYELAKADVKDLKLKNGILELDMDKVCAELNDKKYENMNNGNGSTKDNINKFNQLKEELNKERSENIKLKNRAVDVKLRDKEIEKVAETIKKIRQPLGLEMTKGGNPEADLLEVYKSVIKMVARENKK